MRTGLATAVLLAGLTVAVGQNLRSIGNSGVRSGSEASSSGTANSNQASVTADPILRTFDGQDFEFRGLPGHTYSLITVPKIFQLATKLKPGVMFDHNGTYMDEVAIEFRGARVIARTMEETSPHLQVHINGLELPLDIITKEAEKTLYLKDDFRMKVVFRTNVPSLGTTVQVDTDTASVFITLVAPYKDAGGFLQPYYLNANITVLHTPPHDLLGVLGENYNYVRSTIVEPAMVQMRPTFPMQPDAAYEISSPWEELKKAAPVRKPVSMRRRMLSFGEGLMDDLSGHHSLGRVDFREPLSASVFI